MLLDIRRGGGGGIRYVRLVHNSSKVCNVEHGTTMYVYRRLGWRDDEVRVGWGGEVMYCSSARKMCYAD